MTSSNGTLNLTLNLTLTLIPTLTPTVGPDTQGNLEYLEENLENVENHPPR